jgi:DNA-binding NarL/FixJ family response regulator
LQVERIDIVRTRHDGDHAAPERAFDAIAEGRVIRPARILIADDHELVRQGMRAILSHEPDWVVCGEAATGRQALAMALELQPDILILDLGLPEMNGLEVTRRVRRSLRVPVLIVTVYEADQVVQEAIAAGASGYVLKADAGRTLADAVHAILHHGEFFSERVRAAAETESPERQARMGFRRGTSERLTPREREVLQLLAEGRSNKEVAVALGISTKTAETHRARIMAKLEAHSMSELVRYAIRNRIIEP